MAVPDDMIIMDKQRRVTSHPINIHVNNLFMFFLFEIDFNKPRSKSSAHMLDIVTIMQLVTIHLRNGVLLSSAARFID